MKKTKNPVWAFFASVKLAIITFIILAVTSIIGTIIPQNKPMSFYIREYGEGTAELFRLLHVPDMYDSWWFLSLLVLFGLNLVVCSWERLPNVWRMVVRDNLQIDPGRLAKMRPGKTFATSLDPGGAAECAASVMTAAGWRPARRELDNGILLFSQKGPWTRLGVYVVHASILVIFIGAVIGSLFGFKASVVIPERSYAQEVYPYGGGEPIPLDFRVAVDRFTLTHYDTGAPKEFRSDLRIFEDGQEMLRKSIVVNDPLHYGGLTFYQASYEAHNEFLITFTDPASSATRTFRVRPGREISWPQAGVTFGVLDVRGPNRLGDFRLKIWLSDRQGPASVFWIDGRTTVTVERPDTVYSVAAKQFYSTGLQVAKDPGVWWVYTGCTMMLVGLLIAFFLSHQRVWLYINGSDGGTRLLLAGSSNKNKVHFENVFESLVERIREDETLQLEKVQS